MRDFLFGLMNQQTQAGAVRGLLRKAKLLSSFTASANHLPPFTSTRAHRPAVRAGSHAHSSRWLCLAGIPLPTNLIVARRLWLTGAEAKVS